MDALRRMADRLAQDRVDSDIEILDAPQVQAEVASERFIGGMLYKRSGQMHMGRFANGLAAAAERAGAQIRTGCCVQRLERTGSGREHVLHTTRGSVQAGAGGARHRRDAARRLLELWLAAPAHRPGRQLHRRHRTLGRGRRQRAAARAPHLRDDRQHPPLLPPDAGSPAGVRRPGAVRGLQPAVGREERRDPAPRAGGNLSAACGGAASTTASAGWWT